jgi:hypothetical protein
MANELEEARPPVRRATNMDDVEGWSEQDLGECDVEMEHDRKEAAQDTAHVSHANDSGAGVNGGPAIGGLAGSSTDHATVHQPVGGTPPAETDPSRLTARDRRLIKAKATRESKVCLGVVTNKCKAQRGETVALSGAVTSKHSGTLGRYVVAPAHPWARIHASHVMLVAGGLAFCNRCGKTSSTGGSLHEECNGGCKHPNAKRVCRNLLIGVLPDPRSYPFWPDGDARTLKNRPVTLVVTISVPKQNDNTEDPSEDEEIAPVAASSTNSRSVSPTSSASGSSRH